MSLLLRDEPAAAPVSLGELAPVAELELPPLFCNVPLTSTFLPTSVEKFDALPVSLYVLPPDIELEAPPSAGVVAVGFPAVEPAVPVGALIDDEPLEVDASVRM